MAYDKRKIANSFYLPKHPFLRGIASLMDFTGSATREYTKQILAKDLTPMPCVPIGKPWARVYGGQLANEIQTKELKRCVSGTP